MKNKINTENKYVAYGITTFLVLASVIIFFFCIYRWHYIVKFLKMLLGILMPFIYGLVIAYLVNPMVTFFDKKVYRNLLSKIGEKEGITKSSRALALLTSTIIFIGCLVTLFSFFIPELIKSLDMFIANATTYLDNSKDFLYSIFSNSASIKELINNNFEKLSDYFLSWLNKGDIKSLLEYLGNSIFGTLKFFYNLVIGYIISIYILFDKETFKRQIKKILYSLFDDNKMNIIIENIKYTDKVFSDFFSAKLIDSLIIGILCFIGMIILKMPYALIIAVIVGVTNIIPYFGPFIGAIPSALLILLVDPSKCIGFIIFVFVLQQFDGNILGPKIMGNKTGLSSFWVLFSLLIFGGLFGVVGMIIGVPIFSIIYSFINNLIEKRLSNKKLK